VIDISVIRHSLVLALRSSNSKTHKGFFYDVFDDTTRRAAVAGADHDGDVVMMILQQGFVL